MNTTEMRILLLGEYSNVHATLAEGLRLRGHEVCLASNGDFWKNYPRDINLKREKGKLGGALLYARIIANLRNFVGYDIVQLINPMFVELKAKKIFLLYRFLRKHNRAVVLGGFGMDYYWVYNCIQHKPLRYSDFNIGNKLRTNRDAIKEIQDWIGTDKEKLNRMIANDCDAIVTGLYEYQVCYELSFGQKATFIPMPIKMDNYTGHIINDGKHCTNDNNKKFKLTIFIGINKTRSEYKGTDIMLKAAEEIRDRNKDMVNLVVVESVPFDTYKHLMESSDVILDQLYSYTPAMNALLAMSKGIICVGGGEPENYEILNEDKLCPIINVKPEYDDVVRQLQALVDMPKEMICQLKKESIAYVAKHHDYKKIAERYENLYLSLISPQ